MQMKGEKLHEKNNNLRTGAVHKKQTDKGPIIPYFSWL